jgi:hypothetical protein
MLSNKNNLKPPEDLLEKIMIRVKKEREIIKLKRRLLASFVFGCFSAVVFFPALKFAFSELSQSGFVQFFSLLFSDFKTISIYWQDFIVSLLEIFPATSFLILLSASVALLGAFRFLTKDIKSFLQIKRITN